MKYEFEVLTEESEMQRAESRSGAVTKPDEMELEGLNKPSKIRAPALRFWGSLPGLLVALAFCVSSSGCFGFLKPARSTARHFVLTPLPMENSNAAPSALAIGVGRVKIPSYLFDTSLAVRKGSNEISYATSLLWAERLDAGFQRVLGANLSTLLPSGQIRFTSWRSEDVTAEVYVTIEQFDVDTSGQGVLEAQWRILSPGGDKALKTGESRLNLKGPPLETNPSGAVATLSSLAADLSRQLSQTIKETAPVSGGAPASK